MTLQKDTSGVDKLIGYEVQVRVKADVPFPSYPYQYSMPSEWFDKLEDAETFAFTMTNNGGQKLSDRIDEQERDWISSNDLELDHIECLAIVKHWWTGVGRWRRIQAKGLNQFSIEIKKGGEPIDNHN